LFEVELHHKVPELEAREDYLTSCIFGVMKYLPPEDLLFSFLSKAFNYCSQCYFDEYLKRQGLSFGTFQNVEFLFWPRSQTYGEPDIIITFEDSNGAYLIPVEIKYFSEKHGEEEHDQLAKYYNGLVNRQGRTTFSQKKIRNFTGNLFAMIYLTQFEAELEIEETLTVLEPNDKNAKNLIFHLRWQELAKILEKDITGKSLDYKDAIRADLRQLLTYKNLVPFSKFSELPADLSGIVLLQSPVYFKLNSGSKHFKGFSHLPKHLPEYLLKHQPAFFNSLDSKNKYTFQGFCEHPKLLNLEFKNNIFFGGANG
jgi:hypothetical protein